MERIKVIELKCTCTACPSQWEGKLENGHALYIRYRWGHGEIRVSKDPSNDIMDAVDGSVVFEWDGLDMWDGICYIEDVMSLSDKLLIWDNIKLEVSP